jgi:UDPglucose 6-dehydrogenase/GDP-mannose 6-dehydrogenase
MNVTIVGTGYVGLVSGVCLAAKGHDVTCVDLNSTLVSRLNAGDPHIYERGLPELLRKVIDSRNFHATTDLSPALDRCEVVILAVGTPSENGIINLKYVLNAARDVGKYLKSTDRFLSVVVKSTTVPGTTDTVVKREIESASGRSFPAFGLGMNPEFLREGEAIEDFMEPDRIVLGYEDARTLELLEALYRPWDVDKIRVNARSAEMIKYANNALLATQISAINEIANVAAALGGIDVMDVVRGVHADKRWNPIRDGLRVSPQILTYLVPGCGFGGSCFPKDVQALRSQGMQVGIPMRLLNAVLDVNDAQPSQVAEILERETGSVAGKRILVLGTAFKPGTDDIRESTSLKIIQSLADKGAHVVATDPVAIPNTRAALGAAAKVELSEDWKAAVAAADIVVLATSWPEYRSLATMDLADKVVFDARRMFDPASIRSKRYLAIGRGSVDTRLAGVAER